MSRRERRGARTGCQRSSRWTTHVEAISEMVGLEAPGSELAPEWLRQGPWTWSLLMEDVQPGVPLSRDPMAPRNALTVPSTDHALVHGDFNPGTILFEVSRDRWFVIDSKPLAGNASFDCSRSLVGS